MYNYKEIINSIDKVKNFNITVNKKALHKNVIIWNLKDLYNELMNINNYLFNPELEYNYKQYKTAIEENKTKKELDAKLRKCIIFLNSELNTLLKYVS